jgi:hypothetical protein
MTTPRSGPQDFDRLGDLLPPGAGGATAGTASVGAPAPGAAPSVAAGAVPGRPLPGDDLNQRLVAVWPEVVGAEVAANARPVQLRDGRLVATTSSSAWAQTLQLMSPMIVAGLNERLGAETIDRAVFRHAGWDNFASITPTKAAAQAAKERPPGRRTSGTRPSEAAAPAGASPAEPATEAAAGRAGYDAQGFSGEEQRALEDLELLPLAPAVKERIREAMRAGFVRARQDFGRS